MATESQENKTERLLAKLEKLGKFSKLQEFEVNPEFVETALNITEFEYFEESNHEEYPDVAVVDPCYVEDKHVKSAMNGEEDIFKTGVFYLQPKATEQAEDSEEKSADVVDLAPALLEAEKAAENAVADAEAAKKEAAKAKQEAEAAKKEAAKAKQEAEAAKKELAKNVKK